MNGRFLRSRAAARWLACGGLAAVVTVLLVLLTAPGSGLPASRPQLTSVGIRVVGDQLTNTSTRSTLRLPNTAAGVRQVRLADPTSTVPDVVDLKLGEARRALAAVGLTAQADSGVIDCGPPLVHEQSPAPGTTVPRGSVVQLLVSHPPSPGQPCP
jgi:hypothetical protein